MNNGQADDARKHNEIDGDYLLNAVIDYDKNRRSTLKGNLNKQWNLCKNIKNHNIIQI